MKSIAIMQPYLFPYLGYFQLMAAVDVFVEYDDVNFINRGWINRNNILLNGKAHRFTLPLQKASQNKKINEIEVSYDTEARKKILKTIEQAYHKAPYFSEVYPLIEKTFMCTERNLAEFLHHSFVNLNKYMEIETTLVKSSAIEKDWGLPAQERLIAMTKALGGDHYVNAINGQDMYNKKVFDKVGIKLSFIDMKPLSYDQKQEEFVPYLSIIDTLMFNNKDQIHTLLNNYRMV